MDWLCDVRKERVKVDSRILGMRHCGGKWNWHFLRYRRLGEEQVWLTGDRYELSFVHIKSVELGSLQLSQEVLANDLDS